MRDLFREYYKPSDEEFFHLWQEATFVFDTNVLLSLYRYTPNTRDDLLHIIENLQQRIWLPYHVGLEFSRNRIFVIADQDEIFQLLNDFNTFVDEKFTRDIVQKCGKRGHFFADLDKIQKIFQQTEQALRDELHNARVQHPDPTECDPIFEHIDKLFKGRIGDPYSDEALAERSSEFADRYQKKIPPGFKDATKKTRHQDDNPYNPGNKYGDMIIWFQMIEYAKQEKHPIIFVMDDVKEDWWLRIHGKTIGPRVELRQEMHKKANIPFYMYTSDNFIQQAKRFLQVQVQEKTIEEVRDNRLQAIELQETRTSLFPSTNLFPHVDLSMMREIARHQKAVQQMVNSLGDFARVSRNIQQQQQFLQQVQPFLPSFIAPQGERENSQTSDEDGLDQDQYDSSLDDSLDETSEE